MLNGEILEIAFVPEMMPEQAAWLVKKKKCSAGAVWRDEMKPAFGLQKVGMTWFKENSTLAMKYWPNTGTLADPWAACVHPNREFGEWFIRLCMFDFLIGNGDRHSRNVLVLDESNFLPIDEAMKVCLCQKWSNGKEFSPTFRYKIKTSFDVMQVDRYWLHRFVGEEINDGLPRVLATRDKYSPHIAVDEYKNMDLALPILLRGETRWLDKTFALIGIQAK